MTGIFDINSSNNDSYSDSEHDLNRSKDIDRILGICKNYENQICGNNNGEEYISDMSNELSSENVSY